MGMLEIFIRMKRRIPPMESITRRCTEKDTAD